MVGPRVVAAVRVRHPRQRPSDVLAPGRVDAGRHLPEPVEVVPDVQVPDRDPAAAQLVADEVHGQELAQVAEVHRPGRAGTRGDRDDRRALTRVPHGVVRGARHPVVGFTGGL